MRAGVIAERADAEREADCEEEQENWQELEHQGSLSPPTQA
jgi:hypothetical protein